MTPPKKIYLWQYFADTPDEQISSQWLDKKASDLNITNIEYTLSTEVDELVKALEELISLMDAVLEDEYTPDSFTTQPGRKALAQYHKEK